MIRLFIGLCAILPLYAQMEGECRTDSARQVMQLGVQAFKNGEYAKSVTDFKASLDSDPACTKARLYLGTAYMQQYIPGANSPDNRAMAKAAREQFDKVLESQPDNIPAIASIAALCFSEKRLEEAADWCRRMIALNPAAYESFYTLGVIAWQQSFEEIQKARERSGMKPDDPGPIRDPVVRRALSANYLPAIEEGIANLKQAVLISPEYSDAMAYLNLLYRLKSELENSAQGYADDIAQANDWFQKTIEIRKAKATAGAGTGDRSQRPPPQ